MKYKKLLLIISCVLTISYSFCNITVKNVEPSFWWTDMQNPFLQLMVYGNDVAKAHVVINYPGVELTEVIDVGNPNYIFINLNITENAKPGKFKIEFYNASVNPTTWQYELKPRNENPGRQGFDASDVIYLIMPDRFSNGNPDNDSMEGMFEKANRDNPDGRHGGDLIGIQSHLDYIKNLGVTAIWLNPFLENNMTSYSYHGYAITNFYKTDPRLGTNNDYINFVKACHKKDLKVVMDVVFNHFGSYHDWMEHLPMNSWIHQFPEFTRTNYRIPALVDPHAAEADQELMLSGWFDKTMPDFNQKNPYVVNYLIQHTIWWIEYAGIDAIRLDTQPYGYKELISEWTDRIFAEYPDFNIVGECWVEKPSWTAYWQTGSPISGDYDSGIPSVTDFPMRDALNHAFNEKTGWSSGLNKIYYVLVEDFLYGNPYNNLIFVDNHDVNRYYSSIDKDFNKWKMGMAVLVTMRGIPMIYYGTEILMNGWEHDGHGNIREDFPGGWKGDVVNAFTGAGLTDEQKEAQQYLSNLMNWRKSNTTVQTGKITQFLPQDEVYVYFRHTENKAVMVILNNDNENTKTIKTDRFKEILDNYSSGKEIISGTQIADISEITITAKSPMIIDLQ